MRLRLAAVVLAAGLLTAAPARAAVPAGNLLTDPGGEAATASPDGSTAVPPPGWTVNGPFSVVAYGTPEFLTTDDAAALGGGVNFFAGGPDNAESTATQIVTVVGAAAEIDAGTLTATLSGQLGGYAEQPDSVTVTATYIDGATAALGTLTIGPVTDVDRGDVTKLLARSASGTVPVGTRAIVVRIDALRTSGAFNDGYADNISLTLGNGTPEFHKTVVAGVISGKVLVKKPGAKGFVALDGSQGIPLGSTVDTRNGRVELTSVPKRGGAPEKAQFYDGIFKVTQPGAITQLQLVEALACGGKSAAARGREEAQDAQAVGLRLRLVPHPRPVQRRDRARHDLARPGLLLEHAHARDQGRGVGAGLRQAQDRDRARGEALHGAAVAQTKTAITVSGPWTP